EDFLRQQFRARQLDEVERAAHLLQAAYRLLQQAAVLALRDELFQMVFCLGHCREEFLSDQVERCHSSHSTASPCRRFIYVSRQTPAPACSCEPPWRSAGRPTAASRRSRSRCIPGHRPRDGHACSESFPWCREWRWATWRRS